MKKNPYPGKFIVFEGLDGAGTETQTKILFNYLKKLRKRVEKLSYPDYQRPIGNLIHQYLHKKYDFNVKTQFLIYLTDFVKDIDKINNLLKQKRIIISDRYFTSTLAYQGLKGFPIKNALKIAELINLPKPDLIIYLKISPETSIKRKFKEKGNLDRHESDRKLLGRLTKFYGKLIKKQIFSRWVVINGEKSIEAISKKIISSLKKI